MESPKGKTLLLQTSTDNSIYLNLYIDYKKILKFC